MPSSRKRHKGIIGRGHDLRLHTGVRTIQNTGVFWQAIFQPPRPYSLFVEHGYAAKTLSRTHKIPPATQAIKACSRFFMHVCISSLLIKPELRSEIGAIDVNQRFLVIESCFC